MYISAAANSTACVKVTSNTSWTITCNQPWLTLSSASGNGNAFVTLTATANTTIANRTATITVSDNGTLLKTINVTQAAAATLSLSASTLEIAAAANSTSTFNITSNTSWTIAIDQIWLTSSVNAGSGNATITLTAAANPGATTQTATVTVSATGVADNTIIVTQDAGAEFSAANAPITEKETKIDELSSEPLNIYPDPVEDILHIKNLTGSAKISIYSITGQLMIDKYTSENSIDVSQLASGIYITKITDNNNQSSFKFEKK